MKSTTTVESTGMESAKRMATAEMSSAETMAEEVMSTIIVAPIVGAVVTKKTAAGIPAIKGTHNSVPSASAEQKDGGSNY